MEKLKIESLEDLSINHKNGIYDFKEKPITEKKLKPDHVFDENLSVKKNREMVEEHNNQIDLKRKEHDKKYREKIEEFDNDFILAIKNEVSGLSNEKYQAIFNYIYNNAHSGGYYEMIIFAEDFLEVINKIIQ